MITALLAIGFVTAVFFAVSAHLRAGNLAAALEQSNAHRTAAEDRAFGLYITVQRQNQMLSNYERHIKRLAAKLLEPA